MKTQSKNNTHTLYHLTDKENIEDILQYGLQPQIGKRSELAKETNACIYLADAKNIPYWAAILNKQHILRIDIPNDTFDTIEFFDYYTYSEYMCSIPIPPEWIRESNIKLELSVNNYTKLLLSYIDIISDICADFAKYTVSRDTKAEYSNDLLEGIEQTISVLKFTLPHFDFDKLSAKKLEKHIDKMNKRGEFTLCDSFDYGKINNKGHLRLYELLGDTEFATKNTKWLYEWLSRTFKKGLYIEAGGWTN